MVSSHPKKTYKTLYPHDDLPMESDDYDEQFVSSYADFETENLLTDDPDVVKRELMDSKVFIKNNVYRDLNSDVSAISRVELNWGDGYVQHNLIAGSKVEEENVGDSWFNDAAMLDPKINLKDRLFLPKVYAANTYDIAFGEDKIGKSDYFFTTRESFDSYFTDDPASAGCIIVDNPINPEFIGFKSKFNGIYAFNDIMSYCTTTGLMFVDISTMVSMLVYFAHEVLNVLVPKQIVLVMDSSRGQIDIPRKDYIPNINDPVINIPDYNNKMKHVVEMMKLIVSGRMFYTRMGAFYLKLSITPALTVINFISAQAPQVRLILNLPTIDNQIIYDTEVNHNVYPGKYAYEQNPYWHKARNHDTDKDVLMTIQADYHEKLMGMDGGELQSFMQTYGIRMGDQGFPTELKSQMNVNNPGDLMDFMDLPW